MTFSGTIIRGDDIELTINVVDENGDALDLTGITAAAFKLKETLSGSVVLTKTLGSGVTVTDAAEGELKVVLTNAETTLFKIRKHFFEIQITDASSKISTVRNSDKTPGELTVIEDL